MTVPPEKDATSSIIAAGDLPTRTTLVIGCGNPLRGDDAAGIEVVQRLARRPLPPHICCIDTGTSGLEIVLLIRTAAEVVLIDAATVPEACDRQVGAVHELSAEAILHTRASAAQAAAVSIHAVRWNEALALSRALGGPQPERLTCFLIEGGCFDYGSPLSPAVDTAVGQLVTQLEARLTNRPAVDHAQAPPAASPSSTSSPTTAPRCIHSTRGV